MKNRLYKIAVTADGPMGSVSMGDFYVVAENDVEAERKVKQHASGVGKPEYLGEAIL